MNRWVHHQRCRLRAYALGASLAVAATVALPAGASALGDGRAYELVTPPDKNGYPAFFYPTSVFGITIASDDGDSLLYYSFGTFAGGMSGLPLAYTAKRGADGWSSAPYSIRPVSPYPSLQRQTLPVNASGDLATGFFSTVDGIDPADQNGVEDAYVRRADGAFALVSRGNGATGTGPEGGAFLGASDDGEAIVFSSAAKLVPQDSARVDSRDVYLRAGGRTSLLNIDPSGTGLTSPCGSTLGEFANQDNAVSADGRRIFFLSPNRLQSRIGDLSCYQPTQLYMRVDNERTVRVSASRLNVPEATQPARYEGAARDGSKVFFSSAERLTDDASPGGGLYEYDTGSDELRAIGANAAGIQFLGVSRVSDDGSRVYFVARAQVDGLGVDGKDNMFLAIDDQVRLVATAPTGTMATLPLYGGYPANRNAEISADGRSFLFYSRENLTSYDAAGFVQIYLYDEDRGVVVCVSCNQSGVPTTDTVRGPTFVASGESQRRRTMPADGSKVYFDSRDQLVPEDRNSWRRNAVGEPVDGSDVYEYDVASGRLSLITSGASSADSFLVDVPPSGRDVFFATKESLLPQDVDRGGQDIYNARVGGGFPLPPSVPEPCRGDACQAPPTAPPADSDAGSLTFEGPGDDMEPVPATPRFTVAKIGAGQRARFARSGSLALRVRVTTGGTVTGTVRARVRGRWVVAATSSRRVSAAGTVAMRLRLSRSAQRQLAGAGRLAVRVEVRFSEVRGMSTARFTLKKSVSR